ncbi:MAG: DNA polymerase, partial [Nanoarchaeota archaeon]
NGNRIMFNAFKRMRIFLGASNKDGDLVRSAISFNPQSSIGDLDTIAMCNIQKRLRESDLNPKKNYLMIQVHDSNAGVCERKNVEFVKQIVKEEMEKPIPNITYKNIPLIIPCEFCIGEDWKNLKEI